MPKFQVNFQQKSFFVTSNFKLQTKLIRVSKIVLNRKATDRKTLGTY